MSFQKLPFLDVFEDATGGSIKTPQTEFLEEGEFPVVDQGQALVAGFVNDRSRVCRVNPPVIVFGDHTRVIKYVDFEFAMGADGTKVLVPKVESDTKYLYYALKAIEIPAAGYSRHYKFLKETQIPLPPLPEQRRIAEILDKVDALRAKRRQALAQLDTLTQSIFLDMFGDPATNPKGWEVHRLADVFWLQEGPGVRNWQFKESGIKLLNVSNILKSGELDLSKTDRHLSTDEVQEKYSHFLVDAGDLVIASSGISIDVDDLLRTRSAFVRNEHLPLCMNTSTVRFKATHGVSDLKFLQQWLQSHEFRRQITREVTGIAQKNFGPTHLKRLRITLPPL